LCWVKLRERESAEQEESRHWWTEPKKSMEDEHESL
jgi:hypothetical protein